MWKVADYLVMTHEMAASIELSQIGDGDGRSFPQASHQNALDFIFDGF